MNDPTPASISSTWDTARVLARTFRYIEPFRGRFLVKLGLGVISLIPLVLLPWPAKLMVDLVIDHIPLAEGLSRIPFFMHPLAIPLADAGSTEQIFWIVGFQALLLFLVGGVGMSGRENDHADAYLSSGHDTATNTENEANSGFSMAGGVLGLFDFGWTLRLTQDLNHHYRGKLFERVQALPMTAFDDERIGDAMYRVMYDTPSITNGCFRIILTPLLSLIAILAASGILALAFGDHPVIVWSALSLVPIVFFGTLPFANALRRQSDQSREAGATTTSTVEEGMNNILAVQSLGGEDREQNRFEEDSWQSFSEYRSVIRLVILSIGIVLVPTLYLWGHAFLYGVDMVIEGQLSRGDFMLFLAYYGIIAGGATEIGALWFRVQSSAAGLSRVFYLMDLPFEEDAPGAVPAPRIEDRIQLEGVSFQFEDGSEAVRHVDMELAVGKVTALVGPAGAGKTTLAYLASGYLRASGGRVLVDRRDIHELTRDSVRSQIAFVFQETSLFDETVEENIRLGNPDASDLQVRQAARMAGADEFITALPDGYRTRLGRSGGKLSVGQKQRLSIARALVRDARVLILDEPTSALDPATERQVVAAMRDASRNRAVLIIAHRLSSVREADEILFVQDGEILERGTHLSLMSLDGGAYRRFVELQTQGAA